MTYIGIAVFWKLISRKINTGIRHEPVYRPALIHTHTYLYIYISLVSSRSQEQILNQQRPQFIKAKVNTSHHEQKVEEARRSLQKNKSQQAKKEQELQELRSELAELERAWKVSESQMEKEAAQRGAGVQLEESQVTINVLWTGSLSTKTT